MANKFHFDLSASHDHVGDAIPEVHGPVEDVECYEGEREQDAGCPVDPTDAVEVLGATSAPLAVSVRGRPAQAVPELDAAVLSGSLCGYSGQPRGLVTQRGGG